MSEPRIFNDKLKENTKLWRYLTLERFLDLLVTKELHFARVDKLGDHFEGIWPRKDLEFLKELSKSTPEYYEGFKHIMNINRKHVAISCWHENENESAAMWYQYGGSKDGIAIVTTYGKLKSQLSKMSTTLQDIKSHISRVKYLDHLENNLLNVRRVGGKLFYDPFICKNISYKHECEIRALMYNSIGEAEIPESGIRLPIDLNEVFENIIISPYAVNRTYSSVENLLEKYNCKATLRKSLLTKSVFDEVYEKSNGEPAQFVV